METETLVAEPSPTPAPPVQPPIGGNYRPTPDPSRSGAMWVGGTGVVLLLAAAAVLTAVRWDDIGQTAKLGAMVAVTLGLLGIGQRCRDTIPMTGRAIFHLGALLIPFDMAAVAILAGRSWQETLLLTSFTSVVAWFGIERAVPSTVLRWSTGAAVVGLAAGVAASTPVAMPLALAIAAVLAAAARKATPAGLWASLSALLPLAAFVPWPTRIAGGMEDLGFGQTDPWQSLVAGAIATVALIGVSRLHPRLEVAWAAVVAAVVTAVVALGSFADADVNYVAIAALFLVVESLVWFASKDPLWKQVGALAGGLAEIAAGLATIVLGLASISTDGFNFEPSGMSIGVTGLLFALAWLTADVRRVDDQSSMLAGSIIGSDWLPTTVMFPVSILAAAAGFAVPSFALSLIASALAFWMIASWRQAGSYGAVLLAALAAHAASNTNMWIEIGLGGIGAAVLFYAAQLRVRANDSVAALIAAFAGLFVWLLAGEAAVLAARHNWAIAIMVAGSWCFSWIVEHKSATRAPHLADWIGRLGALVVVAVSLGAEPLVALGLCVLAVALAAIDIAREHRVNPALVSTRATALVIAIGVVLGLAGIPLASLVGLDATAAGVAMTLGGFILAGVGLAMAPRLGRACAAASIVASTVGLALAHSDATSFALALIAVGCTAMFAAASLRNIAAGIAGYAVAAVGVSLGLAVLGVDWLEPYLVMPALAALVVGWQFRRSGGSSWVAYVPTIALFSFVAITDRFEGGSAWHAVIAGAVGVLAVVAGGYRRLVGPLVAGSTVLAIVVGYELLGPAALVPTWAWLATGGAVLLVAGVLLERSDSSPLERGQELRTVIATEYS